MIKHKRLAAAGLATALVLAACGSDDDSSEPADEPAEDVTEEPADEAPAEEPADEPAAESDVTLGIAFDTGGRGDGTFNDSAGRGADRAEAELGVALQELEAAGADDRGPNVETLAGAGANPVVAISFSFGDAVAEASANFPDTQFAVIDGFIPDAPANVTLVAFAEEQGSFLVGAAAALACECDQLGFIGGQEIDLIKKFEAGYVAGAQQVNPDITVEVQYLGAAGDDSAWAAPDKAKEIATAWYADGVEVIYTAAGGSGQGTIEAAVEADKWAIGVDSDQYLTASPEQQEHILTSMLKRVDNAVFAIAEAAIAGTLAGGFVTYDLSTDGVGYSTSGGYLDAYEAELEDLKQQVIDGTIVVPTAPE
ncbi:MAG: BMP family protein [Ilumatobacter sp.]|jgi:basic membrane protein A and related proteins|uniref:BMP family lipoprotein n=1 Tax=Ilumatobacter sp. TaxID=1967498 RepID=UPI00391BCA8E